MEWIFVLLMAAVVLGIPLVLLVLLGLWGYEYVYLEMSASRRRDFRIGFFGALLVNAPLFGSLYLGNAWLARPSTLRTPLAMQVILLAPWVINGGLLLLALRFRPMAAAGMLSLVGYLVVWAVLSFAFVAIGCVALMAIGLIVP